VLVYSRDQLETAEQEIPAWLSRKARCPMSPGHPNMRDSDEPFATTSETRLHNREAR
jgi:hypothetical protein